MWGMPEALTLFSTPASGIIFLFHTLINTVANNHMTLKTFNHLKVFPLDYIIVDDILLYI
jgi:hypothetical protein